MSDFEVTALLPKQLASWTVYEYLHLRFSTCPKDLNYPDSETSKFVIGVMALSHQTGFMGVSLNG